MRVASYNIRKCVGLDWRRDPARTLRVIRALGADIVALQEADKRLGERPSAFGETGIAETGLRPVPFPDQGPNLGWHGNAVLVRSDWRIDGVERLTLPGLEPRGALLVEIATPEGPLHLAATHLGLRRADRQRQLRHLRAAIGRDRMGRCCLLGDLNEWSGRAGFAPLHGALEMVAPGRSFHAARPLARLDRLFLGPELRLAATGVWRHGEARRASDHLPVWAEIAPR